MATPVHRATARSRTHSRVGPGTSVCAVKETHERVIWRARNAWTLCAYGPRTKGRPMQVSKPALMGLGIVGAIVLGWVLHMGVAAATAGRSSVAAQPAQYAAAPAAPAPVRITLVTPPPNAGAERTETPAPIEVSASPGAASSPAVASPSPPGATVAAVNDSPMAVGPSQVDGLSVIANGDHIVIANNGAIISVGDNTVVRGNTGDATSSGTIALDVTGSDIATGNSSVSATSPSVPSTTTPIGSANPPNVANGPGAATRSSSRTRSTAINGYDIRTIDVDGGQNLITYDDSNLFFHRIGNLNGNTGDTDTSGANVVDATRSSVRSGNSVGAVLAPATPAPTQAGGYALPTNGASATVAEGTGLATATGDDTLVIGGTGVDDRGVSVHGSRNAITSHDGNAAIGGRGDVNSQIGNSANGGAVAMKVVDTNIVAGDAIALRASGSR
jgi:hypothetical protein